MREITNIQVKGVVRRDGTIRRLRETCSGHFMMTWAADDTQFVVFADGVDLEDPPTKIFHSRIFRAVGDAQNVSFKDVPAYPDMPMRLYESAYASFWGWTCLAVDGRLYQSLTTSNRPYFLPNGSFEPDFFMNGVKLIYSPDNGATWHNQDGSTPVAWDNWEARSKQNMLFFDEQPEGAFASLSFLQMGKDYSANQDGYVYAYATNGGEDGSANKLMLCRVAKADVLDRRAYTFFAGLDSKGDARWTSDISGRTPVHSFPTGWVSAKMPGAVPSGWWPSVVYNEPLGLYVMIASGTGCEPGGGWFSKPSYLGFWVGPTPWGPFRQIHEDKAWMPANEANARAFAPQIPPKWIAADGRSFWIVWSDYGSKRTKGDEEFNPDRDIVAELRGIADDAELARALKTWNLQHQLNACLNMQRVELIVD